MCPAHEAVTDKSKVKFFHRVQVSIQSVISRLPSRGVTEQCPRLSRGCIPIPFGARIQALAHLERFFTFPRKIWEVLAYVRRNAKPNHRRSESNGPQCWPLKKLAGFGP